jgi:hypothetical protein
MISEMTRTAPTMLARVSEFDERGKSWAIQFMFSLQVFESGNKKQHTRQTNGDVRPATSRYWSPSGVRGRTPEMFIRT